MNNKEVQHHLRALGWDNVEVDGVYGDVTRQAVRDFQTGFAFWDLGIDGHAGPQTHRALRHALAAGARLSPNFTAEEFRCKCGRKYRDCRRIWVHRELLRAMEAYRTIAGPTTPISGCRCPGHNRAVGGASSSQHLYGGACDVPQRVSYLKVRAIRRFSGIGKKRWSGRVAHVDVRHVVKNTTGSSPASPAIWNY